MNRKQRRAMSRALKKTKVNNNKLETKLGLFDLIPEDCVICHAPFDKTNKEMVKTWNVAVRQKEKIVRVYCPTCWTKTRNLLNELGVEVDGKKAKRKN